MAGVKFTDAQKRVIYALGGDLIISASAGSGKTTVMVERIIELILNGTELDRMLINTYTNASAADIRGKLAEKITEHIMLPEYGHTDGEKARLASQLNRVHYAEIGTLHSFCMNTLRSYFYAVGLSPDFVISDELEAGERRDRILDGVIAEKFASDEFYYIFDIFCRRRDTRELKQYIFKVYEFLRSGGRFPEKFDYGAVLCERRGDAARHYLRMLSDSLEGLSPAELEAFDAAVKSARAYIGAIADGLPAEPLVKKPSASKKHTPAQSRAVEMLGAFWKDLRAAYTKLGETDALPDESGGEVSRVIMEITGAFEAAYQKEKQREGALDYDDLEYYMLKLLEISAFRDELRDKFLYVFVDEYQDINPIQERIITAVSSGNNLFMVGDVKQSIYGFRLCDPEIFVGKYRAYGAAGKAIDLNDNFRSDKGILDFCNSVFSELMTTEFGRVDYKGRAMLTGGEYIGKTPVTVALAEAEESEKKPVVSGVYSLRSAAASEETSKIVAEASVIARQIYRLVTEEWMPDDGKGGDGNSRRKEVSAKRYRGFEYSDIVILCRSLKNYAGTLAAELVRLGVPAVCAVSSELMEELSVVRFYSLLKIIDNPCQDIPLAAVLKAPYVGFTDNQMSEIRLAYPDEPFFYGAAFRYADEKSDPLAARLKALSERLKQCAGLADYLTVGELAPRISEIFDCERQTLYQPDGAASVDMLRAFIEYAAAQKAASLSEFIRVTDGAADKIKSDPKARADAGSVRIMSVHNAKGLEFPAVIFAGAHRRFNSEDTKSELILHRDTGVISDKYDTELRLRTHTRQRAAAKIVIDFKNREEELRVLYVAFTRAKYALVITGYYKPDTGAQYPSPYAYKAAASPLKWLLPILARDIRTPLESFCDKINLGCDFRFISVPPFSDSGVPGGEAGAVPDGIVIGKPSKTIEDAVRKGLDFVYPYNTDAPTKTNVTRLNADAEPEEFMPGKYGGDITDDERADPRGTGNAYHKAFELVDINCRDAGGIRADLGKRCADGLISQEAFALLDFGIIAEALNCGFFELARNSTFYREKEFMLYKRTEEGADKVIIQGIIDLLIVEPDGATVVDFKTSSASDAYVSRRYARQLELYAEAVTLALKIPVKRKIIYSVFGRREITPG